MYTSENMIHIYTAHSPCFFFPLLIPFCSPFYPSLLTWNHPCCDRIRPPRSQVARKLTSPFSSPGSYTPLPEITTPRGFPDPNIHSLGRHCEPDPQARAQGVSFLLQIFLKKYSFKGTSKLLTIFDMILRGHEWASGVSYPTRKISAGSQTPLNKLLRGIMPL
jgi:hypothetical protein